MSSRLERAKVEMLDEFERSGEIQIEDWLSKYPQHREELLDYAFWVETGRIESRESIGETWNDGVEAVSGALDAIHNRVADKNLALQEQQLADTLESGRRTVSKQRGKGTASGAFRRAAVYAWTFDQIRGDQTRATRFRTVKTTYLLERGLNLGLFTRYKRKAAGPYDSNLRYRDAEPIGEKKKWLTRKGQYLVVADNIQECHKYARRYLGAPSVATKYVRFLAQLTNAQLETWATVDMAVHDLLEECTEISVSNVKKAIGSEAEWQDKLQEPNFRSHSIRDALRHLWRLHLLPDRVYT